MNPYNGGNSGFGLWQSHSGIGHPLGNSGTGSLDDHRSVYSTDSNSNRSLPSVSHGALEAITPAQAYARSVKTGEPYDRTLHHTIERKQPERKVEPQVTPLHLNSTGAGRGASFAQHLYASALKNKSAPSALSLGSIPVFPSNEPATSLSSLSHTGAGQGSRNNPHRSTSLGPSLSEVPESFNPSDLYNSSVAKHGFPSRNSTVPESGSARPQSMLPVSDPASFVSHHTGRPQSRGSYHQSHQDIPHPETQNSRLVSYQPQVSSVPPQPDVVLQVNRSSTVNVHGPSGQPPPFIEAPPDMPPFHSPDDVGDAIPTPPPPFAQQSTDIPPESSPPPFEEHRSPTVPTEAVAADIPSVSVTVSHHEGLLENSLVPVPDTAHEAVPTYTLVDEEQPPPSFDDLHPANNTETPTERPPETQPEVLLAPPELVEAPSSSSSSSAAPRAPPPPFVSNSKAYPPEKAPAYALVDPEGPSSSVGTSQSTRQGTTMPLPSIATDGSSNIARPGPPRTLSINAQMSSQSPPMSPLTSPLTANAPPLYGTAYQPSRPSVPSSPRPASVLSSRSADSQSSRVPPAVMYHNKPTVQQARQSVSPPPAPQSVARTSGRQEHPNVDALTHSMSKMMAGSSSSTTRTLAYEGGSSTRQTTFGPSGDQKILPASHPPGAARTTASLNRETYGPTDRLLQEAYQPTHAGFDGEARRGIQGSTPGKLPASTQNFSSQHSPGTVPHLGPVPPRYSQEGPQTESVRPTEVGSMFNQLGGTAAPASSRPPYSNQPHNASVPPSLQSSHYSIDRDVHGPVATSGSVPFQPPKIHPYQHSLVANMDPMQRGGHVLPPPLPPSIVSQPNHAFQTPQTSLYSQDTTKYQVGPSTGAPGLNSNDLARKFAHDALLTTAGPPAYAFHGANQR